MNLKMKLMSSQLDHVLSHFPIMQLQNAVFLISIPALGLIRVSISLLYWHLFAAVKLRRFLIFWIVLMVAWSLAFFICKMVQCKGHLEALGPQDFQKYCHACENSGYVYAGTGVLADLGTLIIPIPVVSTVPRDNCHLVPGCVLMNCFRYYRCRFQRDKNIWCWQHLWLAHCKFKPCMVR